MSNKAVRVNMLALPPLSVQTAVHVSQTARPGAYAQASAPALNTRPMGERSTAKGRGHARPRDRMQPGAPPTLALKRPRGLRAVAACAGLWAGVSTPEQIICGEEVSTVPAGPTVQAGRLRVFPWRPA